MTGERVLWARERPTGAPAAACSGGAKLTFMGAATLRTELSGLGQCHALCEDGAPGSSPLRRQKRGLRGPWRAWRGLRSSHVTADRRQEAPAEMASRAAPPAQLVASSLPGHRHRPLPRGRPGGGEAACAPAPSQGSWLAVSCLRGCPAGPPLALLRRELSRGLVVAVTPQLPLRPPLTPCCAHSGSPVSLRAGPRVAPL